MKGKINRRIKLFLVGSVVCLIVLEISLRVVGMVYSRISERDNRGGGEDTITILTVGDSFTFGLGAPRDQSYPAQLERLLNQSHLQKRYSVINRGRPGQNSSQLLLRFEQQLKKFRPDMVTILIGAQNLNNYFGFRKYLETTDSSVDKSGIQLRVILDKIRIIKFFRLVFSSNQVNRTANMLLDGKKFEPTMNPGAEKQQRIPECIKGAEYHDKGEADKGLALILKAAETKEIGSACASVVGSIYREKREFDQAIKWYKRGIEKDTGLFQNYEEIGWCYFDQGRLKEALLWFEKGFEKARNDSLYERCYAGISDTFNLLKDRQAAINFFTDEVKRRKPDGGFFYHLAADYLHRFKNMENNRRIYDWIRADVEKMINLSLKYGAKPILQNYPAEHSIEFVYRNAAKERNLPFVDHQTTFAEFVKEGVHSPEYFIPDGHPNTKGYHLMAENLRKVVQEINK